MTKNTSLLLLLLLLVAYTGFAQRSYADCSDALVICAKGTYLLDDLSEAGQHIDEVKENTCLGDDFQERHSAWVKWEVATKGLLAFNITPLDLNDDVDFVLYQMKKGGDECQSLKVIRCVASGKNLGERKEEFQPCLGPTGLRIASRDIEENKGCESSDDNFAAPIYVNPGESYALFIHNYSSSKGALLEVNGSADLKLERNLEINHTQNENSEAYSFTAQLEGGHLKGEQEWDFGPGANPTKATGSGPHSVTYNQNGIKNIQTTIQTAQGCLLSAVYQIDALTSLSALQPNHQAFELFPNPTDDLTYIRFEETINQEWAKIYVIDVLGKIRSTQSHYLKGESIIIDTNPLEAGTYFVRVEMAGEDYLRKLIKL